MKINVGSIILRHWQTLYDVRTQRPSYGDFAIFYALPVALATMSFICGLHLKTDHYNASITFFGIFLALLLNIQIAIFSIFQRRWEVPSDKLQASIRAQELANRRVILGELNTNIAYLTVVSCVALALFLLFYVFDIKSGFAPAVATFFYIHFLLTFVMIVKRAYALFQNEYRIAHDL